jgi:hypothetical protein
MEQFIAPDSSEDEDYKEGDKGFGKEDSDPDHSIDSKDVDVPRESRTSKHKSKDSKKSKKDKKEKKSKKDKKHKSRREKGEKKADDSVPQTGEEPPTPASASKKRRLKKGADIESLEAEVKDGEQKRQKMS